MGKFALIKFSLYKSEKIRKVNRKGLSFLFYKTVLKNYIQKYFSILLSII